MNPVEHIAVRGTRRTVEFAICKDGTMPAQSFISALSAQAQQHLMAVFSHVAEQGDKNIPPGMFKHERGDIWTFKCKHEQRHIRLPCFRHGNRWIVTHGFVKPPKAKWPEQEFKIAEQIMAEVLERENKRQASQRGST